MWSHLKTSGNARFTSTPFKNALSSTQAFCETRTNHQIRLTTIIRPELPDRLEDWIDEDHQVRIVDAFVDAMDLAGAGFGRMSPAQTGRPSVLWKLFIYGYLNRIPSSRRLEREAGRNVEAISNVPHISAWPSR